MKTLISLAICMSFYSIIFAQKDVSASKLLEKVSSNYNSFQSISAEFTIKIENKVDETTSSQMGNILIKKNKYVLKMDGQEIVSNGNDVWTYLKDVNEVQIDINSNDESGISPINFFTMYEKGFKYKYIGETKNNGKTCDQIDLVPENDDKSFFKIQLYIEKENNLITGAKIFDKGGTHYYYTINKFKSNVPVDDSMFEFNITSHPDIEVIDLR